jgi:hypothetical protein
MYDTCLTEINQQKYSEHTESDYAHGKNSQTIF